MFSTSKVWDLSQKQPAGISQRKSLYDYAFV